MKKGGGERMGGRGRETDEERLTVQVPAKME